MNSTYKYGGIYDGFLYSQYLFLICDCLQTLIIRPRTFYFTSYILKLVIADYTATHHIELWAHIAVADPGIFKGENIWSTFYLTKTGNNSIYVIFCWKRICFVSKIDANSTAPTPRNNISEGYSSSESSAAERYQNVWKIEISLKLLLVDLIKCKFIQK